MMLDAFNQSAREALGHANEEALAAGHGMIEPEDLLLAVLRDPATLGSRLLATFDVRYDRVAGDTVRVPSPFEETPRHLGYSWDGKESLQCAWYEAADLEHDVVGTDHVVLGVLRHGRGVGADLLAVYGVNLQAFRDRTTAAHIGRLTDPLPGLPVDA